MNAESNYQPPRNYLKYDGTRVDYTKVEIKVGEHMLARLGKYIEILEARSDLLGEIIATLKINLVRQEFDAMPAIERWREMVDEWEKKSINMNSDLKSQGANNA